MTLDSLNYIQLAPNFRVITNLVDRYEVKYNLNLTAGGSYFEEEGEKGLTHLLEHCMVARTKDLDFEDLKDFLFESDIYTNAYTSRLGMEFVVSGHKSDALTMLDLILQFGLNPTITQKVLDQEKEIVLREMSQCMGGPGYRLNRILIESVFTPDSSAVTEVLGKREDVAAATLDKFEKILKRMQQNSHIILTVTGGGVDMDAILEKLKVYSDKLPSDKTLPVHFQPRNKLKTFTYLPVVSDLGHDHAVLNIVIPCPVTLANRPIRTFLRELVFEHPAGVLYNRLRNELGLVYGINYSFDISSDTLSLEFSCEIKDIQQIINEVKDVFSDFDKIFTQKKIDTIKSIVLKRRELNQDDPQFVVNFMVNILTDFGVVLNYEDYMSQIENISREDIHDFFSAIHQNLQSMQVVVVSNKSEIQNLELTIT